MICRMYQDGRARMCTEKIDKLLGAILPHDPSTLHEFRILKLAEEAKVELRRLELLACAKTYTSADKCEVREA